MDKVWNKILPLPLGTKVKVIQNTINKVETLGRRHLIGKVGVVIEHVHKSWKLTMIRDEYYPPCILKETMYVLSFDNFGRYAYRCTELEAVE